jgi:hypothetical protein
MIRVTKLGAFRGNMDESDRSDAIYKFSRELLWK